MATDQPGSPRWWLARLWRQLTQRRKEIDRFDRYYRGAYDIKLSARFTRNDDLTELLASSVDNWMAIVVDSVAERLAVEGFRLGENVAGDRRVWRMWQENNLDAESDLAIVEALVHGEAATLTWYGDDDPSAPRITMEHPSQVIVATDPADRRRRLAALKAWQDDDGRTQATLYLPDEIYKFASRTRSSTTASWQPREIPTEAWPLANPLGVVPVVPLRSRRRMLGPGVSEIASVLTVQDRINRLTLEMMVGAYFAAFRQRWATGLAIPKDPVTNQPVEPFKAAVDHLWTSTSKDTRFGDFAETSLENYVKAIEMQVQHLAVQTRTPPHYLFLRGNLPSGETLRAAETGLVSKVRQRQKGYGEAFEETMRLALMVAGARPRGLAAMETQWADPESRTESEHVDGVMKRMALGIPLRQLWEDVGYSQEQIARFDQMLSDEAAYRARLDSLRPRDTGPTPEPPADDEPPV